MKPRKLACVSTALVAALYYQTGCSNGPGTTSDGGEDGSIADAVGSPDAPSDGVSSDGASSDGPTDGASPCTSTGSGVVDTTYGNGTKTFISTDASSPYATVGAAALDTAERLYVAVGVNYYTQGPFDSLDVLRLKSDGTLDTAFGTGGLWTASQSTPIRVTSAVVDSSQRLVLGVYTGPYGGAGVLARITTSGGLDTTFGFSGFSAFPGATQQVLDVMDVVTDGSSLTAAVGAGFNGPTGGGVVRVTDTGAADTTFQDFFDPNDYYSSVVLTGAGGAYAGGRKKADDTAVVRKLLADGSSDTSFASGGLLALTGLTVSQVAITLDGAGRLVLGAQLVDGFAVARIVSGALDPSFGTGGITKVTKTLGGPLLGGRFVAATCAGILVAFPGATVGEMVVARFDDKGVLDATYGTSGYSAPAAVGDGFAMLTDPSRAVTLVGLLGQSGTKVEAGVIRLTP